MPLIDSRRVIPTLNLTPGAPDITGPISTGSFDIGGNPIGAANDPFGSGNNVRVVQSTPHGPTAISIGVMNGRLIFNPRPIYPPIARATGTAGTVVLEAVISKTGSIENLRVVSGPRMLQQAALDAVRQWRYRPYMLDGQPVEVETTVNVLFTLD